MMKNAAPASAAADTRLEPRALVIGVDINSTSKAYPVTALATTGAILDTLGGRALLIVRGPTAGRSRLRSARGRTSPWSSSSSPMHRPSPPSTRKPEASGTSPAPPCEDRSPGDDSTVCLISRTTGSTGRPTIRKRCSSRTADDWARITRTALLVAVAVAAACALSFRPIYEPDLWWHLAQGREAAAGRLVHTNVFNAIYASYPQPYTPWLFDLGATAAWQLANGTGIQIAQAALLSLTFVLTFLAARERATTAAVISVLVLGWFVLEPRAIPRPHLASFAGMATCALLIERARRRGSATPLSGLCLSSRSGATCTSSPSSECCSSSSSQRPNTSARLRSTPAGKRVVLSASEPPASSRRWSIHMAGGWRGIWRRTVTSRSSSTSPSSGPRICRTTGRSFCTWPSVRC